MLFLGGCQGSKGTGALFERAHAPLPDMENGGRLSLFRDFAKAEPVPVKVKIAGVEVLGTEKWIPVSGGPIYVDVEKMGKNQIFLGSRVIPAGRYDTLRLTLVNPEVTLKGKTTSLSLAKPTVEIPLASPIEITPKDSKSLFLNWDLAASIKGVALEQPVMSITTSEEIPLTTNLAYVACPDIDTVYIVRTDKNKVAGSLPVAGKPLYVIADTESSKLYVLTSEDAAIKVLDIKTGLMIDNIRISMASKPIFMTAGANMQYAYVIDERGSYLSRVNLATGILEKRVRIGQKLQYALYSEEYKLVAVSSSYDQTVYLLEPDSLSKIDEISTGSSPDGLLIWENSLYIAETGANAVSVFDLDSRTLVKRINAGFAPSRFALHDNNIYVSNFLDGSISLLFGGQLSVAREIQTGQKPFEMATSQIHRWLYVGDKALGALSVVDLTSRKFVHTIEFGAAPEGIEIIQ